MSERVRPPSLRRLDDTGEMGFPAVIVRLCLGALMLLGACGGDPDTAAPPSRPPSPPPSPSPEVASPPDCDRNLLPCLEDLGSFLADEEGYTGAQRSSFVLAYQICTAFTPEEVADEYGSSPDPVSAAEAYATQTFRPDTEQAGFEGCLAGFEGLP